MNPTSTSSQLTPDTDAPKQPRRPTASTITDPELDALHAERDGLLRLVLLLAINGAAA